MDISLFSSSTQKTTIPQASFSVEEENNGGTTSGTTETQSTTTTQSEEFDTFLNLLTAQIRNQDPLAPIDSTQFVEQLATFSNLELQAKNNEILEGIASMLAAQLAPENNPEQ